MGTVAVLAFALRMRKQWWVNCWHLSLNQGSGTKHVKHLKKNVNFT